MTIQHSSDRRKVVTSNSDSRTLVSKQVSSNGSRIVKLARLDGKIQETITYNIDRSNSYEKGEVSGQYSHNLSVTDDNPIVTTKEYDNNRLISLTVQSGSVLSSFDDGTQVLTKFEGLVLDQTSCIPTSGQISGQIYESADVENAASSFLITFSDGDANISFDSNEAIAFETENCSFN